MGNVQNCYQGEFNQEKKKTFPMCVRSSSSMEHRAATQWSLDQMDFTVVENTYLAKDLGVVGSYLLAIQLHCWHQA